MANSDKDILITPNSGSSTVDPKIEYVGADSSANDTITVETQFDGSKSTLSFEGSAGQLFSVSNDLSGTLFAVNDGSGIPSIEVDSDGEIRLAEFSGNVGIGISTPTELLHVDGRIKANNLTLASLSAQNSEATSIMIDGSGIIGTRELGSNAFNSTSYLTGNQTITLTGDASGSGTTSISVTVADDSHNHIISNVDGLQSALDGKAPSSTTTTANAALPKAGGTMTGGITSTASGNAITISSGAPQIYFNDTTSGADDFWIHVNSNIFYILGDRDDSGSWETPHPLELHSATNIPYAFGNRLFTEAYHPNADTLTTARTIAGTSFNGSANIDINYNNLTNKPTIPSTSTFAPIASPTFTGTVTTPNLTIGSGNRIKFANNDHIRYDDTANRFHFDADGGSSNASVQAVTFVGALSGNATTATTLATARTINGVSFNGSANITVADSTKLPLAGGTMTGALTIDVDNVANGALRIEANQTNPANDFYFAQEIVSTLSGSQTFSADNEQGGIYLDLNSTATGGDTSNEHRVYGVYLDVDSTGDADLVYGVYSNATATPTTGTTTSIYGGYFHAEDNGGAGSVSNLYGVMGFAFSDNATSDVNGMYGLYGKASNAADSGAISAARGVYGEIELTTGSADIYGTSYVFEAQYDNNTGAAPTHTAALYYGNYAGTLPTTAFGVYIVDTVANSFAGTLRVGDGTSSLVSYGFISDTNTGMYSPANHQLGLTANGSRKILVEETKVTLQNVSAGVVVEGALVVGTDDVATNSDANITVKEGNAFAGIDLKSLRTSGNIGGIRSFNSANTAVGELLFEVQGRLNYTGSLGFNSDGGVSSTGYITGTRLRAGDGTDGYFYSDTAGRTAFIGGDFYIRSEVSNCYLYAANTYLGATSGDNILVRGNVISGNAWNINAAGLITSTGIRPGAAQSRVKLGVWSDNTYGIGMHNTCTYGGLNNDYAMTFQMNSDNDRGFLWLDSTHTLAQGAMALTTNGLLTVASGIRVGFGETDTTIPSAGLAVNGNVTLGIFSTTDTGTLILTGTTADRKAEIKCTNGNLHIDAESGNATYINYFEGTSGVFFGNGASGHQAHINSAGGINLRGSGSAPTNSAIAVNGTSILDNSRNLTNIGTISSGIVTAPLIDASATGMSIFATNMSSQDDFINSPISIRERGLAGAGDAEDRDSPNLNFHWSARVSNSLWMNSSGHLNWGSYSSVGVPTNDGTFKSGTIDIRDAAGTGTRYLHVPRSGAVTLYGDGSTNHSISSRGRAFTATDDLRINSYGGFFLNLDSNSNNSSNADLVVGRHGGSTAMATSQDLFVVNGENGNVNIAYDNACLAFGIPGNGANVQGAWATMEGNTDTSGEGSGRLFFREHNSTTSSADSYGMSLGYRGGATAVTTAMGNSWTGLSQIGNGQWGMWGHDANATGVLIMSGDRAATFIDFHSNNFTAVGNINSNGAHINASVTPHEYTYNGNTGTYNKTVTYINQNNTSGNTANGMFIEMGRLSNSSSAEVRHFVVGARGGQIQFKVDGSGNTTATGNVTAYSDERLKENIQTLDGEKVLQMRGVSFTKDGEEGSGVIAQEIEKIAPELVMTADDEMGTKSVAYGNLVGYLIEAIKEQQETINKLTSRLDDIEKGEKNGNN